ncbi:hypothetical protein Bca52824_091689, partial [Brassica carinata]
PVTTVPELKVAEPESAAPIQEDQAKVSSLDQLIVFDHGMNFQKTFLGTFLISPFVWNKTREVELSRHELGMKHVVFEPGGELWHHRNNTIMIEKKSAATTIVFGDLLPSGDK